MIEWPAKCARCAQPIEDWADAGLFDRAWLHKRCWSDMFREKQGGVAKVAELRSPLDRSSQLELPMMVFLLMFHFGLAGAVAGWFLLTQTSESERTGIILLVAGLVIPLIGAIGAYVNIVSRRRIELIRHQIDLQGGWKPGR